MNSFSVAGNDVVLATLLSNAAALAQFVFNLAFSQTFRCALVVSSESKMASISIRKAENKHLILQAKLGKA